MRNRQILIVPLLLGALAGTGPVDRPHLVRVARAEEGHDRDRHGPAAVGQHAEERNDRRVHEPAAGEEQAEHAHGEHDVHGERSLHAHEDEARTVHLDPDAMREFGVEVQAAAPGEITRTVRVSGEVVYNADRLAHVRPTVAGSVQQVNVSVGDHVAKDQTMALLASRELAAARSEYLAAVARLELARENLQRDRRLFADKVGPERAFIESRQAYREADIEVNQAENALYALGYSRQQVARVAELEDTAFNTFELLAPLAGIVTRRHITIGEVVGPDSEDAPFVVADLSSVWVNLTVYQRDLAHVRAGQAVTIELGHDIPDARGTIAFVSPALDETTRTATARVVLENPRGDWRPGLFVSAHIETDHETAAVVVPRSAVTELDGETVVFVQTEKGFEPREVRLGRVTPRAAEIVAGLTEGERYVSGKLLVLKAEMNRAALEHAGHVH